MFNKFASIVAAAAVVFLTSSLQAKTIFYGPTPYLSAADSPFDLSGLGTTFWLEDFEDGALNTPGVSTRSSYYVTEPGFGTDSVDADDGVIDSLGSDGRSFFASGVACSAFSCAVGANFHFDRTFEGNLPNAIGLAWTDGRPQDQFVFQAYDADGELIGFQGPFLLGDGDSNGGTAEDRFIGIFHAGGISELSIYASHPFVSFFEIDHLQYGYAVPEPSSALLGWLSALCGVASIWRRARITHRKPLLGPVLESLESRVVLNAGCAALESSSLREAIKSSIVADLLDVNGVTLKMTGYSRSLAQTYAVDDNSVWLRIFPTQQCGVTADDLSQAGMNGLIERNGHFEGPINKGVLAALLEIRGIELVEPVARPTFNGIHGQGDLSLRADDVRTRFSLDGSGAIVGVISDSFDNYGNASADILNDELPSGAYAIHDDFSQGSDEGRAMMQIVHDIAPGAELVFSTGFSNEAVFDRAMDDLLGVGANVIVDDITYWESPFFQDGAPAQRVNEAVGDGVTYFTSAGNFGNLSRDDVFRPSSQSIVSGLTNYGVAHDFDPLTGAGHEDIFQSIAVPGESDVRVSLQWAEPFRSASGGTGATNNLELLVFLDPPSSPYPQPIYFSTKLNTLSGNADESVVISNPGAQAHTFYLAITRKVGTTANLAMKYIVNDFDQTATFEYAMNSSSTIFGHANTATAAAVGAAYYHYGPDFSGNLSPKLQVYSSRGGTPILFNTQGNPTNESRQQPMFVAPDGGNISQSMGPVWTDTSVQQGFSPNVLGELIDDEDGPTEHPNFFGTSAAAPHAAGVAALIKQAWPEATPAQIYDILKTTATDYGAAGFDYDWGHGLIDALSAVYKAFKPSTLDLTSTTLFDTGISQTDNITTHRRPEFRGTVPANSFVELFVDAETTPRKTVQLSNNATSYVLSLAQTPLLSEGDHFFKIRVSESASVAQANRSRFSDTLKVTVDLTAPTIEKVTIVRTTGTAGTYDIPVGSGALQLKTVGLGGANAVRLTTSERVDGANEDIVVKGRSPVDGSVTNYSFNAASFT